MFFVDSVVFVFAIIISTACGGNLDGNSGSITYPATPGTTYPHGVDCAWKIRASQYNKVWIISLLLL